MKTYMNEWGWRSMSEDDDQDDDEYYTTSENDELVTHLLTHELHHYYNCNYCFTLVIPYMHIVPYKYQ